MTAPIRVAHCGLGQWGPNLLRNLGQNPRARVAALCDLDRTRLSHFAESHPDAAVYTTIQEVADSDVDAVVLATPAGLHAEQVRQLIEVGKDVLVEKPLALTLSEARDLVNFAEDHGRILMVGHTFLFNPAVRRVKEEIGKGTLGPLVFVSAQRMSLGRIRSDCNALWNLAPHDVSILLHWIDAMPVRVSARGMALHPGHKQEDISLCTLEFPGPTMASIQVSWMNPVKVRQMTVVGRQRMMLYDDVNQKTPLTLYHQRVEEVPGPPGSFERFQLEVRPGAAEHLDVEQREPLALEIEHFLECIATRQAPIGSGRQALRIMSVLEACDRSMKHDGKPMVPEVV